MAFGQFGAGGAVSTSAFKVPTGRPKSIIAQALAGHPNWRGPQPPSVGSAGLAGLSAGGLSKVPGTTQPAAPTAPPAPTPPAGSPLDATYYNNVAGNDLTVGNKIAGLQRQDTGNLTALQTALGNLAYQQPRDQLALEQRANAGGGLYSSVEDQNQSNLAHSYLTRQNAAQTTYDTAHGNIVAAIAALQQGVPIYDTGQAIDSANRAAVQAQANPALGAPAPAGGSPAASSSPGGGGGAGGRGGSPRSQTQEARAEQRAQQAQSSTQRLAQALTKRKGR